MVSGGHQVTTFLPLDVAAQFSTIPERRGNRCPARPFYRSLVSGGPRTPTSMLWAGSVKITVNAAAPLCIMTGPLGVGLLPELPSPFAGYGAAQPTMFF